MAFNTRIKNKRDTAANWETRDPVLLEGEIIIVTTNAGDVRFKIGDGVKTYTQLPFQDESLYNILSAKANSSDLEVLRGEVDNKQTALTFDSTPTENSANPVTSGGVYSELEDKLDKKGGTVDGSLTINTTGSRGLYINAHGLESRIYKNAFEDGTDYGTTIVDNYAEDVPARFILKANGDLSEVVSVKKNDVAYKLYGEHNKPTASDITSGTLSVARGGTGNSSVDTTPTSGSTKMVTSGGIYTALSGKADSADLETLQNSMDVAIHSGAVTTAGTGAAYTATVPGITALTAGVSFIMVPHTASTATAVTLNVNGLGAKSIKRRASTVTGTLKDGYAASWLGSGNPIHVIYNGTYWVVQGMEQPNVYDLSGAVPVAKGGTGYTDIADTTYTTARYRASALYAEESIVDPTTNGVINWAYA